MLQCGRFDADLAIETLMMIDSLQMTHGDREAIAGACRAAEEQHIMITHGTDTMEVTAGYLYR